MSAVTETHYTVKQVAAMWGVSENTIRRSCKTLKDHAGVLAVGHGGNKRVRAYVTYTIAESGLPALREVVKKGRDTKHDNKPFPPGQGRRLKGGAITPKSIDELWKSL